MIWFYVPNCLGSVNVYLHVIYQSFTLNWFELLKSVLPALSRIYLSNVVKTMVADDHENQRAKSSEAVGLAWAPSQYKDMVLPV